MKEMVSNFDRRLRKKERRLKREMKTDEKELNGVVMRKKPN